MIPQLIPTATPGEYLMPPRRKSRPYVDWSFGTRGINVTDEERTYRWTSEGVGDDYFIFIEGSEERHKVLTKANVKRFAFDFDQLMRPVIGYAIEDTCYVEVPTPTGVETREYPNHRDICVTMDDSSILSQNLSDVILTMLNSAGELLCYVQREGYNTKHVLKTGATPTHRIYNVGMTTARRLQWKVTPEI
ncbi:tail fiber [Stenotrophomonas phage vB_SmeS_BUCT700]|uniref:Tail fiber n=1 Tax=Stenotrophomonas phage vB_SmeS_BUCT700 TaxID=2924895 RepID=A0AAE9K6X4_9CAUD|nr:tail fiber [Stenotrophomonas phage vB_SmeS_BUCT700]UNY50266.1 tail fiber [Stenotrophomonas phage vB_SmeS_BUCT703]